MEQTIVSIVDERHTNEVTAGIERVRTGDSRNSAFLEERFGYCLTGRMWKILVLIPGARGAALLAGQPSKYAFITVWTLAARLAAC